MKTLLNYFALSVMVLSFFNCVVEPMEFLDGSTNSIVEEIENSVTGATGMDSSCINQDPKARITNNGTKEVDLYIYDADGNLIAQENELEPGEQSEWIIFTCGETTFLLSTESSDKMVVIDMGTCMIYDMEIGSNDQLVTDQAVQL